MGGDAVKAEEGIEAVKHAARSTKPGSLGMPGAATPVAGPIKTKAAESGA